MSLLAAYLSQAHAADFDDVSAVDTFAAGSQAAVACAPATLASYAAIPDDGYISNNLGYHLAGAGQLAQLRVRARPTSFQSLVG